MLKPAAIVTIAALTLTITQPAKAQGIPVYDNANVMEAIKDGIMQLQHLQQLMDTFTELTDQGEQMLDNARALADLSGISKAIGFYNDLVNSTLGQTVMAAVYGIDPSDPDFIQKAMAVLSREYQLPLTPDAMLQELTSLGVPQPTIDSFMAANKLDKRALDQINATGTFLATSRAQSRQALKDVDRALSNISSLGDDSAVATAQQHAALTAQSLIQGEQAHETLRLLLERQEADRLAAVEAAAVRTEADKRFAEELARTAKERLPQPTSQQLYGF
jgi:hypothetical protein